MLDRFAVIEMKPYDTFEDFKQVTLDVLKDHPLAEFIAEQVYKSSKKRKANVRDCVRIGKMAKTEQDVLRLLRVFKQ